MELSKGMLRTEGGGEHSEGQSSDREMLYEAVIDSVLRLLLLVQDMVAHKGRTQVLCKLSLPFSSLSCVLPCLSHLASCLALPPRCSFVNLSPSVHAISLAFFCVREVARLQVCACVLRR